MIIELFAATSVGAIIGFGACAVLTAGKVGDVTSDFLAEHDEALKRFSGEQDALDAHARCADALETARNRIERALEQITPGSNATVKRIARILRGEQGA